MAKGGYRMHEEATTEVVSSGEVAGGQGWVVEFRDTSELCSKMRKY